MCGIFGIITPTPRKFDRRTFCVLGVNNDSRGGDSCGVFIDKNYEYGVNHNKLFYNFFQDSKVINSTDKCRIAIGHCRKASVGAINAANAQPVIIKDEAGNIQFVVMHNGTIVNYKELAAKYIPDINITDMTDSQVMALIFYHAGYDVLGEYIGAGAFVMVDYRKGNPEVFLFKGLSKTYEYSTATTVERPLFLTYNNHEFVFSSIMDYLRALRPEREVKTLLPNRLVQLQDGSLNIIQEYDRTNLFQIKSNIVVYSTDKSISKDWKHNQKNFKYWDGVIDMDKDGIYWLDAQKAHGIFWVDALGNVEQTKIFGTKQVAFWKGVILKNLSCYTFLSKFARDMGCSHTDLIECMPDLVHFLSPCACWKTTTGNWVASSSAESNTPFTGKVVFPFTNERVEFIDGKLISYTTGVPYKDAMQVLNNSADYKVDFDALNRLFG